MRRHRTFRLLASCVLAFTAFTATAEPPDDAPAAAAECSPEVLTERYARGGAIGIGIEPVESERSPYGLKIRIVADDGPAAEAGLRPGDVIVSVDGRIVGKAAEDHAYFGEHHRDLEVGDEILYTVRRDGEDRIIEMTAGPRPERLTEYFVLMHLSLQRCPNVQDYFREVGPPYLQG